MGVVRCGKHNNKCCWACDKCPKCSGEFKRVLRGDYCPDCTQELKDSGHVWSSYYQDYVKPENVNTEQIRREEEYIKPVQELLFNPQKRLL